MVLDSKAAEDIFPSKEKQILEVFYELFPSLRNNGISCSSIKYLPLTNSVTSQQVSQQVAQYHPVNKPEHYNLNPYGIEAIDAIKAATCDAKGEEAVFQANVIKYIWRYRRKNGLEDLKKAAWYLEKLIGLYENGRYKTL